MVDGSLKALPIQFSYLPFCISLPIIMIQMSSNLTISFVAAIIDVKTTSLQPFSDFYCWEYLLLYLLLLKKKKKTEDVPERMKHLGQHGSKAVLVK